MNLSFKAGVRNLFPVKGHFSVYNILRGPRCVIPDKLTLGNILLRYFGVIFSSVSISPFSVLYNIHFSPSCVSFHLKMYLSFSIRRYIQFERILDIGPLLVLPSQRSL